MSSVNSGIKPKLKPNFGVTPDFDWHHVS